MSAATAGSVGRCLGPSAGQCDPAGGRGRRCVGWRLQARGGTLRSRGRVCCVAQGNGRWKLRPARPLRRGGADQEQQTL